MSLDRSTCLLIPLLFRSLVMTQRLRMSLNRRSWILVLNIIWPQPKVNRIITICIDFCTIRIPHQHTSSDSFVWIIQAKWSASVMFLPSCLITEWPILLLDVHSPIYSTSSLCSRINTSPIREPHPLKTSTAHTILTKVESTAKSVEHGPPRRSWCHCCRRRSRRSAACIWISYWSRWATFVHSQGCVVAGRLAYADPNLKVMLIEGLFASHSLMTIIHALSGGANNRDDPWVYR